MSFHAILDAVRRTASPSVGAGSRIYHKDPSPWLLLEADAQAATIDRVYKVHEVTKFSNEIVAGHRSQHMSASEVGIKRKRVKTLGREMILERNPKWRVLRQILDEIHGSAFKKM